MEEVEVEGKREKGGRRKRKIRFDKTEAEKKRKKAYNREREDKVRF